MDFHIDYQRVQLKYDKCLLEKDELGVQLKQTSALLAEVQVFLLFLPLRFVVSQSDCMNDAAFIAMLVACFLIVSLVGSFVILSCG